MIARKYQHTNKLKIFTILSFVYLYSIFKITSKKKIAILYGFWARGLIKSYFFKNENENTITVNAIQYHEVFLDFLLPTIYYMDVKDMWFQQDCNISHSKRGSRVKN